MSLLDVFKSSVSEYLGGEASPVRTSGGQDDESTPEPKDGGQPRGAYPFSRRKQRPEQREQ